MKSRSEIIIGLETITVVTVQLMKDQTVKQLAQIYGALSLVTGCDEALEVCCLRVRSIDRGPFMQRVVDSLCTCGHRRSKVLLLHWGMEAVGARWVVAIAVVGLSLWLGSPLLQVCNSVRATLREHGGRFL